MSFHTILEEDPKTTLGALHNSVLIIPNVSIANIPQLTIDLLLSNYEFTKVGYLDDSYLYPFVSAIDSVQLPQHDQSKQQSGFTHCLEIFHDKAANITLIQQRSPIISGFNNQFISQLKKFIFLVGFQELVILDSCDLGVFEVSEKIIIYDEGLLSSFKRLTIDEQEKSNSDQFSKVTKAFIDDLVISMENDPIGELNDKLSTQKTISFDKGDTNQLPDLKVGCILIYCYEGDNSNDAELLYYKLTELLKLSKPKKLIKPISWKGMYGDKAVPNALEEGLFG